MATFVIVHGGFSGGWEWTPVARQLRGLGHEVYTPTLTGMGEHSHLSGIMPVGLSTHVQDIVALLEFEDLHDVVLVGSGYGGIPVTMAADRVAHRVGLVVYLDALVPNDGECALDLLPAPFGQFVRDSVLQLGESWRVPTLVDPMPAPSFASLQDRDAHAVRLRDQPVMTFVEPVYLTGAIDHVPRAYLRCTLTELADEGDINPVDTMVARAQDGFWHFRELAAPHDPQITHVPVIVRTLAELVASVLEKLPARGVALPTQVARDRAAEREKDRSDWMWSPS